MALRWEKSLWTTISGGTMLSEQLGIRKSNHIESSSVYRSTPLSAIAGPSSSQCGRPVAASLVVSMYLSHSYVVMLLSTQTLSDALLSRALQQQTPPLIYID
eukprot:4843383-Pyramimonas_sp.AAC.1